MMNNKSGYITVGAALLMVLMAGCEKQRNPFPSGTYLTKVIYHLDVDQIRHYHYNGYGQLSRREYEFNGKTEERFEYQYQKGLISRIDFYAIKNYNDFNLYFLSRVEYEYNSDNIVRSILNPGNLSVTYTYNDKSQIIKSSSSPSEYTVHDYDNRGNLIKSTVHKDDGAYWQFFYEYDLKSNPFYNIEPIHESFGIIDLVRYRSPNNLVRKTFINEKLDTISDSEFIYQYNSENLPVQSYELFTSESNGYHRDSLNRLLYVYEIK